MLRFRSLLSLVLALVTVFLVSCGSPTVKKPPVYTQEQISQIQVFVPQVEKARSRFPELQTYIERRDWVNVDNFIHGPLGEFRKSLAKVAQNFLPSDRKTADKFIDAIFEDLEALDRAALDNSSARAVAAYNTLVKNVDSFTQLIP